MIHKKFLFIFFCLCLNFGAFSFDFQKTNWDSLFREIIKNPNANQKTIEALKHIPLSNPDSIQYKVNRIIGVYYGNLSEHDSALTYFLKAMPYTVPNSVRHANVLQNLAIIYRKQNKHVKAINTLRIALKIFQEQKDFLGIGYSCNELAANYNDLGNNDYSIKYLLNGIKGLEDEMPDNTGLLPILQINLADSYIQNNNLDLAEKLLLKLIPKLKIQGDFNNYHNGLEIYGVCLMELKKYQLSEKYLLEAVKGANEVNNTSVMVSALGNLGSLYSKINKNTFAQQSFNKAFQLAIENESNTTISVAAAYFFYLNKKRLSSKVIDLSHEAIPLLHLATNTDRVDFYNELGTANRNLGNFKEASLNFEKALQWSDSLLASKQDLIVHQIQAIYQTELYEKDIKILNENNTLLGQKASNRKYFLFLGFIILLLISYLLFTKYQKELNLKLLKEKELESEKLNSDILLKENESEKLRIKLMNETIFNQKQEILNNHAISSSYEEKITLFINSLEDKRKLTKSEIISKINMLRTENFGVDYFEKFESLNQNFIAGLKRKYTSITVGDIQFCSLLKLNLSNKEIASILDISLESVITKKYRLKKKLNLTDTFDFEMLFNEIDMSTSSL
ncbi:MAG: hypothetical protein CFE21_12670 [Bacteroidetes bacterium B1(2017)]|nr:MAG: hypothetical protein CFE21_12670 [Bacteroidetes bacterium B1(2017)]